MRPPDSVCQTGGGRSFFPHANGQYASKEWQAAQAKKHGHDHEIISMPGAAVAACSCMQLHAVACVRHTP